jgi:hypothetical protein
MIRLAAMVKTFLTALATLLSLTGVANAQQFPSSNEETGCVILVLAMTTKVEDYEQMATRANCQRMKSNFENLSPSPERRFDNCLLSSGLVYNRTHTNNDFSKVPIDVQRRLAVGCLMLIIGAPEAQAEAQAKRFFQ